MDALDALQNRVSIAQLGEPAPDDAMVETLLQAAIRAPDHGVLRPWRFIVLRGEDRNRLGDLLVTAKCEREPSLSEDERDKLRAKPLRAPLVLVAVAEVVEGHRVPVLEQIVATGAAVQNIMVAAHALGIGAMWRTGSLASSRTVKQGLGFADKDEIVGFIYLGTPCGSIKMVPADSPANYLRQLP